MGPVIKKLNWLSTMVPKVKNAIMLRGLTTSRADDKMSDQVRCRKCRTVLISVEENDCMTNCHGTSESVEESKCYLDKSILYVKDEKMPSWLETLVQLVSQTNNIKSSHVLTFAL